MSYTRDLCDGLGAHLAANGIGVWRPTGTYTADETAIVVGTQPSQPNNCVLLNPYPVEDNVDLDVTTTGVQFRVRMTTSVAVLDVCDAIFDLLHGARHLTLGGVKVNSINRQLSTQPPQRTESDLYEQADSYYLQTQRPSLNRRS